MSPEEFRRFGRESVDWVAHYLETIRDFSVETRNRPGDLVRALPAQAPSRGEPMEEILRDFRELVVPANTHWNHPRFHAYFSVSASPEGILGELLASALNTNGMLWKSCPANVELEVAVMNWLRQWLGLPETFFGMIHDTASLSTLHAIAAARALAQPEQRQEGAQPGYTIYCSEHAHSSVEKGALSLGIGQRYVRKVRTDAEFRMDVEELERAIAQDRAAGLHPFCVVSAIGTTSVTSVDPVRQIQAVAEREQLWHHVDAAYGGALALLDECRWMFDGMASADSIVFNPHKWLFTPIDLSAFYCRRPDILQQAFSLVPTYLKSDEDPDAVNFMNYGIALGRRFRALKLWFVMRSYGREGVEAILRQHLAWTRELTAAVAADPRFELCAPSLMSLVCFRLKSSDEANRRLLERINATGHAFLQGNTLRGKFMLRFAIGHYAVTREDVMSTWSLISRLADETP
jgi:aromatic-L-amino-acid decarboxylase